MAKYREYVHQDYGEIYSWMAKRKFKKIYPASFFSDLGIITPNMAVGFLYITNSRRAYLDGYISNPDADKIKRKEALNTITQELIRIARSYECQWLECNTELKTIQELAKKHGFQEMTKCSIFLKEI